MTDVTIALNPMLRQHLIKYAAELQLPWEDVIEVVLDEWMESKGGLMLELLRRQKADAVARMEMLL